MDNPSITSTVSNFYTGLKFESEKHFYGRVAPEGILALHMEIDLFTAAERPKRILVSKCTFTGRLRAFSRIKIRSCTCMSVGTWIPPGTWQVRCVAAWAPGHHGGKKSHVRNAGALRKF